MRWEVPTMRSATSFFDKTIARSDLRRHWPIAFIYACVWIVCLPVNLWSSGAWAPEEMTPVLRAAQVIIGSYSTLVGALFVFGCVLAMALMGYLMSPRAVGLLHALPVRRGTLLATHTLVGWLMLNVPALLAALVSIPVQAYYGVVAWGALGTWLLVHFGLSLFFLALGLLCSMVTGWLLAIPALYAVVNFAVIAAAGLVRTLCGLFCYGYAGDDDFAPFVLADARGEPREAIRYLRRGAQRCIAVPVAGAVPGGRGARRWDLHGCRRGAAGADVSALPPPQK